MKSTGIGMAGVAIVVLGLTIAAFAYSAAQGPAAPTLGGRSDEAIEAEAAAARTGLVGRLETALGSEFAGVWFEPSTAQVHVGVTSAASRQRAEEVATQAGLEENVTETPVRATWAELESEQKRWSLRVSDLLQQGDATTGLLPDRNSLQITLSSRVTDERAASLRHAAAAAHINVLIADVPSASLSVTPNADCKFHKENEAFCNPPIVSSVTILNEKGVACAAGPTAITKKRDTLEEATETFLLTAGHCPEKLGDEWYSYEKEPKAKLAIGPTVAAITGEKNTDIAAIQITSGTWLQANDPIVLAPKVAAPWKLGEELNPIPTLGEGNPMAKGLTCLSGPRSSIHCGEVVELNVEAKLGEQTTIHLVKVEAEFTGEGGDSGAPWFNGPEYVKKGGAYIEGVHVGSNKETGFNYFHSIKDSFKKLEEEGYDLELLTEANKIRHPVFTADKYPVTVSGKDTSAKSQLTAFGSTMSCKEVEFDGEFAEPKTEEVANTIELAPTYKECTTSTGLAVKVTHNECKYKFTLTKKVAENHYDAEVALVCPGGKPGLQFDFYPDHASLTSGKGALCTLTVPPQTGLKAATLTNSSGKIVLDKGTIEGIKVKIHRHSCSCPSTGTDNETTTGIFHINEPVTVSGTKGGEEDKIDMAGG